MKKLAKNKARPEGSIAEGYIANEALTFCSLYLHGIETRFNRPERNWDIDEERKKSTLSIFNQPTRLFGRKELLELQPMEYNKVHWYILNNCVELQPYIE